MTYSNHTRHQSKEVPCSLRSCSTGPLQCVTHKKMDTLLSNTSSLRSGSHRSQIPVVEQSPLYDTKDVAGNVINLCASRGTAEAVWSPNPPENTNYTLMRQVTTLAHGVHVKAFLTRWLRPSSCQASCLASSNNAKFASLPV